MYMVISKRISSLRAHNQLSTLSNLYWRTHKFIVLGGLLSLLLISPFSVSLQIYLKSPTLTPIWFLWAVGLAGVFLLINNAFFQGMQRFSWLGGIGIFTSMIKIVLSIMLVTLGFGVNGALAAALLACCVSWLVGMLVTTRSFPSKNISGCFPIEPFPLKSVLPILITNIAFAAMTQLDIVLVNWYFPPQQAGLYAAASVLGKATLYLPGGLVMALYPMAAEKHAKGQESAHLLLQAVLVTMILCSTIALTYWLLGEMIITLFYGQAYAGAGELLRWYGFAMLPMALAMVAEYFLISKGRILFAWIFLGIAPLQILAINFWHAQMWMVIAIMGVSGSVLVAVGYGMLWSDYKRGV
jgi:O-antigen/teichoic acid export membrane protein